MVSIFADFSYSLRQLMRAPGFASTVIATLATGIGVSAAMFTVVDRGLLRPLPYRAPAQLVEIKEAGKKGPSMFGAAFLDIQQWRERSHSLQNIAFHTNDKPTSFLEGNGDGSRFPRFE
ncbi:MAG: hypothetical protein DMG93_21900 [Acidobacteria bacterium]|nr:MAG: hypothetical protein DMG93_21900 [Acidobacteriota bacterium]